jgi:diguanylate cyclase (GGDEF)-like protein/PAS domain S-box-containing protein
LQPNNIVINMSLSTKLLFGAFIAAVSLILVSLEGNSILGGAEKQLSSMIENQVKPLVMLNGLQSQLDSIRIIEDELPLSEDIYAINGAILKLKQKSRDFSLDIRKLAHTIGPDESNVMPWIIFDWNRYAKDIRDLIVAADKMDLKEARRITQHNSGPRFESISRRLNQMSETMEDAAYSHFRKSQQALSRKRVVFWIMTSIAVLLIFVFSALVAQSASRRIRRLRDAAVLISDNAEVAPISPEGSDELTDLATAFNLMQVKIMAREYELKREQDLLEERVRQRTDELSQTNVRLHQEIEERLKSAGTLRLLSKAVEQSPVAVMITDTEGSLEYVNQAFIEVTGYSREEVIGRSPRIIQSGRTKETTYQSLWATIKQGDDWSGELLNRRKNGELYWEQVIISPVINDEDEITHFLAVKEDITLRKQQEEKIRYQAQYDPMTHLPNRMLAMDRLQQALENADRHGEKVALLFIDLDDFKKINDSLGHDLGDKMLIKVGQRLRSAMRRQDTVARHGGDEFIIIMESLETMSDLEPVLGNLLRTFTTPFTLDDKDLVMTTSIGVAIYPDDGTDSSTLLRNADHALYQAKDEGGNTFSYYNKNIHSNVIKQLDLESEMRSALAREEFEVYYQPLVDSRSGDLLGAEALIRWQNEKFGNMPPGKFIPVAEQTGLIVEIGDWVLQVACRQACNWGNMLGMPFSIGVNVSPRQFRDKNIIQTITGALDATELAPDQLNIEITEGMLIRKHMHVEETLERLHEIGVTLAMDDFGTGYSSLGYIKKYPFNVLKIDRSFVRDIPDDPEDCALAKAIITMGHELGLEIVAEGVETDAQARMLTEAGCNKLQGYLIGHPVPCKEFEETWVKPTRLKLADRRQQALGYVCKTAPFITKS